MNIGFTGLGVMGQPMTLNLARERTSLVVWNRSPEKCEALRAVGAKIATRRADVFKQAQLVIVMLFDSAVLDSVLARGTPDFAMMVAGHTIINTSSTSPPIPVGSRLTYGMR